MPSIKSHTVKYCTALLIALVALVGCTNKDAQSQPQSSTQSTKTTAKPEKVEAELMQAVFGKNYNAQRKAAIAELPDPDNNTARSSYAVTAWHHTTLPSGETILLTSALALDESGNPIDSHATSGLLSLYALHNKNGKWETIKRNENFDALGSHGNPGTAYWVQLGKGKTGLAMGHGGTWQGFTIEILALYDVSNGDVKKLTKDHINIHSDNNGWCRPSESCWDVSGKWKLVAAPDGKTYDDLLIEFSGEEMDPMEGATDETPDDIKRKVKPVKALARYRFDGVAYKLVEGKNPAPSF